MDRGVKPVLGLVASLILAAGLLLSSCPNPLFVVIEEDVQRRSGSDINVKLESEAIPDGAAEIDIGTVLYGESLDIAFTVENLGGYPLQLSGGTRVVLAGNAFALKTDISVPSIPPGGSAEFVITFTPDQPYYQQYTATLQIASDDADENPFNFTVKGSGAIGPEINVKYGGATIGDGASDYNVGAYGLNVAHEIVFTVQNLGIGNLSLSGSPRVTVTGSCFSLKTDAPATVSQGSSGTFVITFTPEAATNYTASISIANDDSDENPYDFTIQGTGDSPHMGVYFNSSSIADGELNYDLGSWGIGIAAELVFEISNDGLSDLHLTGSPKVVVSGTGFSLLQDAPATVPTGPTGSFAIAFLPVEATTYTASISIANDDSSKNPYNFTIQATGVPAEIDIKQGVTTLENGTGEYVFTSDTVIDGNGGNASGYVEFTISNKGAGDLMISNLAFTSGEVGDFDLVGLSLPDYIPASGYRTFLIRFDPLAVQGLRSAVVTITNTDLNEGSYSFTVKGNALKKLLPPGGAANDYFGFSSALSGSLSLVGAMADDVGTNTDQGSAFLFGRDQGGNGVWGFLKQLVADDGAAEDNFGRSVACSGDTAVVGAPYDDVGGNSNQGSAYIFCKDQGGISNWGQKLKLVASDGGASHWFGDSSAIDGDIAVVGATYGSLSNQGSAYVFYRNQGGTDAWGEVKELLATDGEIADNFGKAVAISGDYIVVGAYQDDVGINTNQGSAYVFYRNQGGADNWGQVKKLVAGDGATQDQFGLSVAISGDYILVGAPFGDGAGGDEGSAYVFYRYQGGADNWGQVKELLAAGGTYQDQFGYSVALSGDTAVVGAKYDHIGSNADQGSACLFGRNQGGADNWGQLKQLVPSDGVVSESFGTSMAMSGDLLLVGAEIGWDGASTRPGSAYVYSHGGF